MCSLIAGLLAGAEHPCLYVLGTLKPDGPAWWFLGLGEKPVCSYTQGTGLLLHPSTAGTLLAQVHHFIFAGQHVGTFLAFEQ